MKKIYSFLVYTALLWLVLAPFSVLGQKTPNTLPQTLVFKLKPGSVPPGARKALPANVQQVVQRLAPQPAVQKFPNAAPDARLRARQAQAVDLSLIYQLRYNANQTFEQVKKQLLETNQVEYVEPLYLREPLHQPNDPRADSTAGSQRDYLKKIMAFKAWDISKGDTNVVIGILDTGVRLSHEDLVDQIKYNYADPIDGIDNDNDGLVDNYYGWDFADDDNNPTAVNGHGTMVTGIASAEVNNEKGIAGVGYKCKFLPLKVFASTTNSGSFGGYEAIVYAADKGCKVINLSWGSVGFPSAFEQDVITYAAVNKDAVVVAAAGNENADLDYYPATYLNVVSVGALTSADVKNSSNTYSYNIDLGAQGINITSTGNANDSNYGTGGGSSYASPMVAGAAALVRSHFPDLNAQQVGERLRVTADDIYHLEGNASYFEKLGKGRLNVYRALSEINAKAARATAWEWENNALLMPGSTVNLFTTFKNFLAPLSSLTVKITSTSEYLEVVQGQRTIGSMATLASASNSSAPFVLRVKENAPMNAAAAIRFEFTDGTYSDFQYVKLILNPNFVVTDANDLFVSVFNHGNLAYDGVNYRVGQGVKYNGNSNNLLAEGGLMLGYSATQVSDNIRNEKGTTDKDFYAVTALQRKLTSPFATFEANNLFEDSLNVRKPMSMRVQQNVLAWAQAPSKDEDFVVLEYILTNRTENAMPTTYAGLYADWDVVQPSKNVTEWDSQHKMGIIRPVSDTVVWTAIQLLSAGTANFYGLENSTIVPGTITITDGFTPAEKYQALSGGVQRTKVGGTDGLDVSYVISSSVKPLAPAGQDTVAFAVLAAPSRAALKQTAAAALAKYQQFKAARIITSSPAELLANGLQLYPNPSAGRFKVTLPVGLQASVVGWQVVNSQGQFVAQGQTQGTATLNITLENQAAGLYFLKLSTPTGIVTRKFILQK
ncbi:S8 family peptidase [Rufibacter sp. LB8]|uniref:S8 family peptidase n=1 Tax=Rufibacter sp. LB8 TaxID=2777781 RepID=UPI00178C2582|nr:S8 family peptidase [Rufibacter sp. LB8]